MSPKKINPFSPHATSEPDRIGLLGEKLRRRIVQLYEADFDPFHYPIDS